jgi:hypothetical protein
LIRRLPLRPGRAACDDFFVATDTGFDIAHVG